MKLLNIISVVNGSCKIVSFKPKITKYIFRINRKSKKKKQICQLYSLIIKNKFEICILYIILIIIRQ
jgi:hypothetical protein